MNLTTAPIINFDCLQIMDLLIKVEFAIAGNESIWCLSIKQAIKNNIPAKHIISALQDMIGDNYDSVADVLGIKLTNQILSL